MKKKVEKMKIRKVDLRSMNVTEEQKKKLKKLFPEVFNEKKIDWERLKATLGEELDEGPYAGRYGISWAGKADCFRLIQKPSFGTLKPALKESLDWDNTQNLFIEGDNLEVLKLLQRSYDSKVKMIYIDPPYNTGKDFVYPDNYSETLETYLKYTGQKSQNGLKFSTNQETDGRFHSKWLNMMYPRLFLAKNLLRDDGVIFISIDDNEVANLRKICDEIFGEENFVGQFIVNSTPNGRDYGHIAKTHEFCLFYSKDIEKCKTNLLSAKKIFKYCDEKGGFNIHPLYNSNEAFHKDNRPNLYYPFFLYTDKPIKKLGKNFYEIGLKKKPSSIEIFPPLSSKNKVHFVWRWNKEKALNNLNQEIIGYKTAEKNYRIVQKMRTDKKLIRSIIFEQNVTSRKGTAEVEQLLNGKFFLFPKPVNLIKNFLQVGTDKNDIILDFFAGSGTTAHAVYEKNLEDGGNRRYILVQLPEPTVENSEAHKAGFKNIADIGKERIRRAIQKIKDGCRIENTQNPPDKRGLTKGLDLGFKVFKLSRSNFKIWDGHISKDDDTLDLKTTTHKNDKQNQWHGHSAKGGAKSATHNKDKYITQDKNTKEVSHSQASSLDKQVSQDNNPSGQIKMHLEEQIDKKSTPDDLLYEILLKTGYPLTTKITKLTLKNKTVYSIENSALLICLEQTLSKELIKEIALLKPARVVCLDKAFENKDHLKTSAKETFNSQGVMDFKTI